MRPSNHFSYSYAEYMFIYIKSYRASSDKLRFRVGGWGYGYGD